MANIDIFRKKYYNTQRPFIKKTDSGEIIYFQEEEPEHIPKHKPYKNSGKLVECTMESTGKCQWCDKKIPIINYTRVKVVKNGIRHHWDLAEINYSILQDIIEACPTDVFKTPLELCFDHDGDVTSIINSKFLIDEIIQTIDTEPEKIIIKEPEKKTKFQKDTYKSRLTDKMRKIKTKEDLHKLSQADKEYILSHESYFYGSTHNKLIIIWLKADMKELHNG